MPGESSATDGDVRLIAHQVLQRIEQPAAVVVDRADCRALEQLRKRLLHQLPILQHVRHAGRAAQIVFEHVVLAVGIAHQVGARDVAPHAARRLQADALLAEALAVATTCSGSTPSRTTSLLVVQIVDQHVQRGDSLLEPTLEHAAIRRGRRSAG